MVIYRACLRRNICHVPLKPACLPDPRPLPVLSGSWLGSVTLRHSPSLISKSQLCPSVHAAAVSTVTQTLGISWLAPVSQSPYLQVVVSVSSCEPHCQRRLFFSLQGFCHFCLTSIHFNVMERPWTSLSESWVQILVPKLTGKLHHPSEPQFLTCRKEIIIKFRGLMYVKCLVQCLEYTV